MRYIRPILWHLSGTSEAGCFDGSSASGAGEWGTCHTGTDVGDASCNSGSSAMSCTNGTEGWDSCSFGTSAKAGGCGVGSLAGTDNVICWNGDSPDFS